MARPTGLGVLVPAGNPTVEPERYRMAPSGVTVHFARMNAPAGNPGAADGMVSYLTGFAGEAALLARLEALAGTRGLTAAGAITAALEHLGVRRAALATP